LLSPKASDQLLNLSHPLVRYCTCGEARFYSLARGTRDGIVVAAVGVGSLGDGRVAALALHFSSSWGYETATAVSGTQPETSRPRSRDREVRNRFSRTDRRNPRGKCPWCRSPDGIMGLLRVAPSASRHYAVEVLRKRQSFLVFALPRLHSSLEKKSAASEGRTAGSERM
jgi:hypothetical protein